MRLIGRNVCRRRDHSRILVTSATWVGAAGKPPRERHDCERDDSAVPVAARRNARGRCPRLETMSFGGLNFLNHFACSFACNRIVVSVTIPSSRGGLVTDATDRLEHLPHARSLAAATDWLLLRLIG